MKSVVLLKLHDLDGAEIAGFEPKDFCIGHISGERRWRVLLRAADGRVVASNKSFATREEAYEYGLGWLAERGAELSQ